MTALLKRLRAHLVDDVNCMWRWWTTWLNIIGTAIATYALSLTPVVNALLPFLPANLKPYAPLLGALWGVIVQALRSIKQAPPRNA
jgi:hypothetical protein